MPNVFMPIEKYAKGLAPVTVLGLFFRVQFCERLADRGKIEQRIVAKTVYSSRSLKNHALCLSLKHGERFAVARGSDCADKSSTTLFGGNTLDFANQLGVVKSVVGVAVGEVRFLRGIAGGTHSGRATQRVNLQAGIVGNDNLSRRVAAVGLGLFSGIGFEGCAIFDHSRQRRKIRNRPRFNSMARRRTGEVAKFSGVRGRNQNVLHAVRERISGA